MEDKILWENEHLLKLGGALEGMKYVVQPRRLFFCYVTKRRIYGSIYIHTHTHTHIYVYLSSSENILSEKARRQDEELKLQCSSWKCFPE